jgi:hypothetical protein
MEQFKVLEHKVVWTPKSPLEYCNMLSQAAVDTVIAGCKQLRGTGQLRDVDMACEIENLIKRYTH